MMSKVYTKEVSKLSIMIEHDLPGRLRLRLSKMPAFSEKICEHILGHDGVEDVYYNLRSRSLLIKYDTSHVKRNEIIIRAGLTYSLDQKNKPVHIRLKNSEYGKLEKIDTMSGLLLFATTLLRFVRLDNFGSLLNWVSAGATGMAVFQHATKEYRNQGHVDPEVVSLFYLLTSLGQPKQLVANWVTWGATFGRHLIKPPDSGIILSPVLDDNSETTSREVILSPVEQTAGIAFTVSLIPMLLRSLTGGDVKEIMGGSLWRGIKEVSQEHRYYLHALGGDDNKISVTLDD